MAAFLFIVLLCLPVLWWQATTAVLYAFVAAVAGIGFLSWKTRFIKPHRTSWQLPLIGYGVIFLLGLGLSISNENIRREAAIAGLLCFAWFSTLGWYHTVAAVNRAGSHKTGEPWLHAVPGVLCNMVLTALGLVAGYQTYQAESRVGAVPESAPAFGSPASPSLAGRVPVWIDTDPACGAGPTADVDDCWALLAAARLEEIAVRGISTVFGNVEGPRVDALARQIVERFFDASSISQAHVFTGQMAKGDSTEGPTAASRALAAALEREPLTIIALGPLTNISTLIRHRPDLLSRIARIVVVAGKRPGQLFHPGRQWWFHFGDFNVAQDPRAAEVILYSGVPVVLVPFDLATNLTIVREDLERLRAAESSARWLADTSRGWLTFWQTTLGQEGFYPFDLLAVAYVAMPQYFTCRSAHARIGFSFYLELFGMGRDLEVGDGVTGPSVTFCMGLGRGFKEALLTRLTAHESRREARAPADGRAKQAQPALEQGS
jgi:purine nucleosidase